MFKVSFKNDFKKIQIFNGKTTKVSLKGNMKVSPFMWGVMSAGILEWAFHHPTVVFEFAGHDAVIMVSGKSSCSDSDTFDAVKGEMIAESRAKIRLYKFLRTMSLKIHDTLSLTLTGTDAEEFSYNSKIPSINRSYFKYCGLLAREKKHLDKLIKS